MANKNSDWRLWLLQAYFEITVKNIEYQIEQQFSDYMNEYQRKLEEEDDYQNMEQYFLMCSLMRSRKFNNHF